MAENKSLLALLNGIARHDYFGDKEMTDQFLQEELFPQMNHAEFEQLTHKSRGVMKV